MSLSPTDRTALKLAATPYKHPAIRETHAREQLGLTPAAYWAQVNRLLDNPDAEAAMPAEVRRLRRIREQRAAARSTRRLGA